ncbi:MAG TPA: MaoC family dehydratase [Chloroflexota bacterium]|jgi:acyl dehydratase|nr:MaoC family dehydratase [Chloroflexota bacterium]
MTAARPLHPGATLPGVTRRCDLLQAVRLAGATENYHRLHFDHAHARALGLPRAVVDPALLLAWFEALVADTYGPTARLRQLQARFHRPVLLDEAVRCEGTVEQAVQLADSLRLTLRLSLRDAAGRARAEATAAVEVPTGGGV